MKVLLSKINPDIAGFITSLLCAIHCAILPFLLTLAPLAGLSFLHDPWFEYGIIAVSFVIASYALVHGYRCHHGNISPLVVVVAGFLLIGAGHWVSAAWGEALFSTAGALMVALAHLINWRHIRQSAIQYPDCIHKNRDIKEDAKEV